MNKTQDAVSKALSALIEERDRLQADLERVMGMIAALQGQSKPAPRSEIATYKTAATRRERPLREGRKTNPEALERIKKLRAARKR